MAFGLFSRKPASVPLEDQLRILGECGISVRRGITVDDFLVSWSREEYERDPFKLALFMLGSEVGTEPWGRLFSEDIWHLDTECIVDHGDYVKIGERMRELAKGDLPMINIRDHVDLEAGQAWLEFEIDGQVLHWDAEVQDDWVDTRILSRFAELLFERYAERRFTYLDLDGQDCLLGSSTPDQLAAIRKQTGCKFQWLT